MPRTFALHTAVLSDTQAWSRWPSDSGGAGTTIAAGTAAGRTAATAAAMGEAVERYCGNLVPPDLPRGSARHLRSRGHDVVDLSSIALFDRSQFEQPGFPFVPLHDDLELEWARGTDVLIGRPVLVPASLVWVSYVNASPGRAVPFTNPVIQAGLATGTSLPAAIESALMEVLERDTMAVCWHGRQPLRELVPPPALARTARGAHDTLSTRFLSFTGGSGPVVGALVHDSTTGYLTLGAASRPHPLDAARKALAEACQLQMFVADYDDPHGPYMAAAQHPRSPLAAHRADRTYLGAYRVDLAAGDFSRVRDYGCHLQLFLDPRAQHAFSSELDEAMGSRAPLPLTDVPVVDADSGLGRAGPTERYLAVAARLSAAGHRTIAVDVTTDDVRPSGLRVVRVLVTGTYTNTAAGLPVLGGDRLRSALDGNLERRRALPLPH